MRISDPESNHANEFSLIKSNLRSYDKILRSLIKEAKQCYYEFCFQHSIKQTWLPISTKMNTKKHTDMPEFFTWNNKTVKGKTKIANHLNLFFTNNAPEKPSY